MNEGTSLRGSRDFRISTDFRTRQELTAEAHLLVVALSLAPLSRWETEQRQPVSDCEQARGVVAERRLRSPPAREPQSGYRRFPIGRRH